MIRKQSLSFKHALEGLKWVLKTQPNFKIHIFLSILSILGGWYFKISYVEFLIILTLIFIGLVIEAINTGIEETIDALNKDWSHEVKIAKDVSAASMLIFALGSTIIAAVIFAPRILALF
ncbi:diacylglycerol kinase family protein [Candidatus Roizmanbacteria bacterium]|nr:diacylglycerol kinase family protein [Candidatus Roizmanbacteria bacterium]